MNNKIKTSYTWKRNWFQSDFIFEVIISSWTIVNQCNKIREGFSGDARQNNEGVLMVEFC